MTTIAYIGCRTSQKRAARGKGIEAYTLACNATSWLHTQTVPDLVNPSFLLVSQETSRLYAIHGDESEVSAFAITPEGHLTYLNSQATGGRNPVHLAFIPDGRGIIVANYATGSASVLPLAKDGSLEPLSDLLEFPGGPGPHRTEQQGCHPHQVLRMPGTNRYVFPDKGADAIWTIEIAPATRKWIAGSLTRTETRECAGPRHGVFDETSGLLHIANELDSTLVTYVWRQGSLHAINRISLLPAGFTGNSRSAGIDIDQKRRCLYISNRGHESITVCTLDPRSGLPTAAGWVSAGGTVPRFITLAPETFGLIVANEGSDTVKMFSHADSAQGETGSGPDFTLAHTGSPTCIAFFTTPSETLP